MTAILIGVIFIPLLARLGPPRLGIWTVALVAGFLWANAFEYAYHRWLLHWATSSFGRGHLEHHASVGMPNEPEHVVLGQSPMWIVVLFAVNGIPMALADGLLRLGFAAPMLLAFVLYFLAVEEIHWRFHVGGWLPRMLDGRRRQHMAHHDVPDREYSIFLPLWDRLLRTAAR